MADTTLFWTGDSGVGGVGDCGPYAMTDLDALIKAIFNAKTGVIEGMVTTESTPNAKTVEVTAGKAVVRGKVVSLDADTLTIADNASGNPRIDRIVLRADWSAQTIRFAVLQGTPAGSPTAPTLTQNDGVLWEESLAQIAVADSFTSISQSNITRERNWARADWPGRLEASPLSSAPDGWLLCDGRAVSRTTYADLFDALGTTYGVGDGSTTFNIPDLRGQVVAGLDDMGTAEGAASEVTDAQADTLGGAMGAENHTLTEGEMPSHTHSYNKNGSTYSSYSMTAGSMVLMITPSSQSTGSKGGDQAHNNMQPTTFLNYIIKA